jgi:hypothetical protein
MISRTWHPLLHVRDFPARDLLTATREGPFLTVEHGQPAATRALPVLLV